MSDPLYKCTQGPYSADLCYIVAPHSNHPDIYLAEIAEQDAEGRIAPSEEQEANRELFARAYELLQELDDAVAQLWYLKPEKFDNAEHKFEWEKSLRRKEDLLALFRRR